MIVYFDKDSEFGMNVQNIRLRGSKPQRCRRPVGGWIKEE